MRPFKVGSQDARGQCGYADYDSGQAIVASGKCTRMFLDVIPFDTCRYIYDWLPTLELINDSFDLAAQQLVYRFALDGLTKHTIRYSEEYFSGTTVVGVNDDCFTEKLLIPRAEL